MSEIRFALLLAVLSALRILSAAAAGGILAPILGGVCSAVNVCGKGDCVQSADSTFGFECRCQKGWKQTVSGGDQSSKFVPCLVPNCSLNNNCDNAAPPPPHDQGGTNSTILNPCHWVDCRGGSCNKASTFTYTCDCNDGYYNLFNSTSFPCYKECEIGLDCSTLGINIMNSSNPSPPPPSTNMPVNSNGKSFIPRVEFSWSVAVVTSLVLVGIRNR